MLDFGVSTRPPLGKLQSGRAAVRIWLPGLLWGLLAVAGCDTRGPGAEPEADAARPIPAVPSLVDGQRDDPYPTRRLEEKRVREGALSAVPIVTSSAVSIDRPAPVAQAQETTGQQKRPQFVAPDYQARAMSPGLRHVLPVMPAPPQRERYPEIVANQFTPVTEAPVSTFSIDVDSASYANVRRLLNQGQQPPVDAVRVEEMINYFHYAYAMPADRSVPFAITTEMGPSPWASGRHLLHVGLRGYSGARDVLPSLNLVFLIDTSGSMQSPNKLDLVKASIRLLGARLRAQDHISLVVYAGSAGVVLEPTRGDDHHALRRALASLHAGGSTNGGAGIELAYSMARKAYHADGVNRVILATDGDFNVGTVNVDALESLVVRERQDGVALTVLGFGAGNYNDAVMQRLAQKGNGNAAYIDSLGEARKVLVDEMASTLEIIASDVKIQVEFNPALVSDYRLIGYETRHLAREDFNNDQVDAGEVGPGHTVTALYEVVLHGSTKPVNDPLRFGTDSPSLSRSEEIAEVKLRYKRAPGEASRLLSRVVLISELAASLAATSENYRFSAAVAGFGQLLSGSQYLDNLSYLAVRKIASGARGEDELGYRSEFISLVATAEAMFSPVAMADTSHQ